MSQSLGSCPTYSVFPTVPVVRLMKRILLSCLSMAYTQGRCGSAATRVTLTPNGMLRETAQLAPLAATLTISSRPDTTRNMRLLHRSLVLANERLVVRGVEFSISIVGLVMLLFSIVLDTGGKMTCLADAYPSSRQTSNCFQNPAALRSVARMPGPNYTFAAVHTSGSAT